MLRLTGSLSASLQVGVMIKLQIGLGFDASGVHALITDGVTNPDNWGMYDCACVHGR